MKNIISLCAGLLSLSSVCFATPTVFSDNVEMQGSLDVQCLKFDLWSVFTPDWTNVKSGGLGLSAAIGPMDVDNVNNSILVGFQSSYTRLWASMFLGEGNDVSDASYCVGIGNGIYYRINGSVDDVYYKSAVFAVGLYPENIVINATDDFNDTPLFVLGNGAPGIGARSNALLITKGGKATFTGKGYVEPTTSNPNPDQPETLVVEGRTTLKGAVRIRPSGDLPMGDFTGGGAL